MARKKVVTIKVDVVELGKKGGEARARNMSPEQRSEAARQAARARWGDKKKPK